MSVQAVLIPPCTAEDCNGQYYVLMNDGLAPYTVTTSQGNVLPTLNPAAWLVDDLCVGNLDIVVLNANGLECSFSDPILAEYVIQGWISEVVPESCPGANDGGLTACGSGYNVLGGVIFVGNTDNTVLDYSNNDSTTYVFPDPNHPEYFEYCTTWTIGDAGATFSNGYIPTLNPECFHVDVLPQEVIIPLSCDGGCVSLLLNSSLCANGFADIDATLGFDDTGLNVTYAWSGPEGFTANAQDISVDISGTYTLLVTVDGNTCQNPEVIEVTQNDFSSFPNGFVQLTNDGSSLSNGTFTFGDDLEFDQTGYVLIQNSTFIFPTSGNVIVRESAFVEFVNCTFTSCENWGGIDVIGNSATSSASGILRLYDCFVEYAQIAIETKDLNPNVNSISPFNWKGGSVRNEFTEFSNNRVAAKNTYNNEDNLYTWCNFKLTDEFYSHFPGALFQNMLYLDRSNKNKYNSCNLVNSTALISGWGDRGNGIYARRSRFVLQGAYDDNAYINIVQGFNRGVKATQNQKHWLGFVTRDMRFNGNHVGIYMQLNSFASILRNEMSIGESTGIEVLDESLLDYEGIYGTSARNFEIAENHLLGSQDFPDVNTMGVRINNANNNDEVIYHNIYTTLTAGNVANGDNVTPEGGLRYVCNQHFDNTLLDIAVANGTEFALENIGIGPLQFGDPVDISDDAQSAGNTFTDFSGAPPFLDSHFRNNGAEDISYWCIDLECPDFFDSEVFGIELAPSLNQCPTFVQIVGNDGTVNSALLNDWKSNAISARADFIAARYLHLSLLDGGSTTELQEEVEEAWSSQTWAMRADLLSKSPHLSMDVLRGVANNTITFPHPVALEILMANPQVLRNSAFMAFLEAKADPMPAYMVDVLWAMDNQSTVGSILQQNMLTTRSHYQEARTRVIRAMLVEENPNYAAIDQYVSELESFNSELLVVDALLDEGNATAAQNRYNSIATNIRLSDADEKEHQFYGDWLDVRLDMVQNGIDFDSLSATHLATLTILADNYPSTYAGSAASTVLNEYYGTDFFQVADLGVEGSLSPRRSEVSTTKLISLYPNPANTFINLVLAEQLFSRGDIELSISDQTGRLVQKQAVTATERQIVLNTSQWSGGTYNYQIVQGSLSIQKGSFNVVH